MAAAISSLRGTLCLRLSTPSTSLLPTALRLQPAPATIFHLRPTAAAAAAAATSSLRTAARCFHAMPALQNMKPKKKPTSKSEAGKQAKQLKAMMAARAARRDKHTNDTDPKMPAFKRFVLATIRVPPPIRMGRNRHLRHWTIHRAWNLLRRQQREDRTRVLMRQWQSMRAACEELRLTSGPGARDEGYLYRVAMEKKGVYGHNGIPIEYARAQTETPARQVWNHEWKR